MNKLLPLTLSVVLAAATQTGAQPISAAKVPRAARAGPPDEQSQLRRQQQQQSAIVPRDISRGEVEQKNESGAEACFAFTDQRSGEKYAGGYQQSQECDGKMLPQFCGDQPADGEMRRRCVFRQAG